MSIFFLFIMRDLYIYIYVVFLVIYYSYKNTRELCRLHQSESIFGKYVR